MIRYLEDNTRTDRRDRALEHWHLSLEQDPDQPRIHKLIARYAPKRGDPEDVLFEGQSNP